LVFTTAEDVSHTSHDVSPASQELVAFTSYGSSSCIQKDWKVPQQLTDPHRPCII